MEHTKEIADKYCEIYDHTHEKIEQLTDRIVNTFNKQHSYRVDLET